MGPEIICHLRYRLDPAKIEEFERYARIWVGLIRRYGGTHSGYFRAADGPAASGFSFPGIGSPGPSDAAFAIFSFPDEQSYENYRSSVRSDPECETAEAILRDTNCFLAYERTFVSRIA